MQTKFGLLKRSVGFVFLLPSYTEPEQILSLGLLLLSIKLMFFFLGVLHKIFQGY